MAEYTDAMIGKWVRRIQRKAHLIESEIDGDLITNCGKRLHTDGWLEVDPPWVDPDDIPEGMYCRMCR